MSVDFEPMDALEQELRQALKRQPAPMGLKRRVMARRGAAARRQALPWFAWRGLAASMVSAMLCILAALSLLHGERERQRQEGEKARQQVLMALRITNHALDHMNRQLAAHHRDRKN
jgi:hypothetical protein